MNLVRIITPAILLMTSVVLADYQIGVGIADVTGPSAEVVFMGYAKINQKGEGIHLRQFARAFILQDGTERIVFVSADIGMMGHGLRRSILRHLKQEFGDIYNEQNVVLSGTHTHGGPGGYLMNVLFDISCMGFIPQTYKAIQQGVLKAIRNAHHSMEEGKVFLSSADVLEANINRSPAAYLLNPEEERAQYKYDVDKELVQLKLVASKDNRPLGVINWFPVHPTSMNNSNHLITSDNVGLASLLFEKEMNNGAMPGKGEFVAAFASSNLGDVSPNIMGAKCINTGEPCDMITSTCNGEAKYCIASGPGKDMFESTRIIANRINEKALQLFKSNQNAKELKGPLRSIHQYVDMTAQEVEVEFVNGTRGKAKGCRPAMGYSFAAGTTDGPGEFDFKQGTITENPFWNFVGDFLAKPSKEDEDCQAPKPILLATGVAKFPYEWQPKIVSSQIISIGDLIIAAFPGELTTMSGRRMKKAIREVVMENGGSSDTKVVLAGLSNTYSDYVATPQEYQLQRYEAASTIYGPYTLDIHIHQFSKIAKALITGDNLDEGPIPEDFSDKLISFQPPVILDLPDYPHSFGECTLQPANATVGQLVTAEFVSGHPRNDLRLGKSYLLVERQEGNEWIVEATDASWETKFKWRRTRFASSRVTIEWQVPEETKPGLYRIRHFGANKSPVAGISSYAGVTNTFSVHARTSNFSNLLRD